MLQNLNAWIRRCTGSGGCPTDQQLAEYADQQVIGAERHVIEKHLAYCDRCLRQVGFLVREPRELSEPVPDELIRKAIALGKHGPAPASSPWRWVAISATGLAVAFFFLLIWSSRTNSSSTTDSHHETGPQPPLIAKSSESPLAKVKPDTPTVRGNNDDAESSVLAPRPGETIKAGDLIFRWRTNPDALFYEVQVTSDDGDVLWETRCYSTSIQLPSSLHLAQGKTYFFRLRVHTTGGSIERSKPVNFVIG